MGCRAKERNTLVHDGKNCCIEYHSLYGSGADTA